MCKINLQEFVSKYQKYVYIGVSELIFLIFFNLALYLIAIPTFGDMSAFDTFYLQYMLILLSSAGLNWAIGTLFFKKSYYFLIASALEILVMGFLGAIVYYFQIESVAIGAARLLVLIPKFGLYILVDWGIIAFVAIYTVVDVVYKIFVIKDTNAIEQRRLLHSWGLE